MGGEGPRPGVRRLHLVYAGGARIARARELDEALRALESDLQLHVAVRSRRFVFVHAGVVGWRGRAILLPGRSHSGKSTLVAALLEEGAAYYSDEYALIADPAARGARVGLISHYRRMIDDPVRIAAFERAIRAAVKPGDVVVDLGCAFGNYAVLACRAGAAKVYAVEAGPVAGVARRVAEANGLGDRIEVLRGRSTELDAPERADVVVYEDYPGTLVSPASARVSRDAVERWLAPGGRMVPARGRLFVAPAEAPESHAELDCFESTGEQVAGVDIGPTRRLAFCETVPVQLAASALLAEPQRAAELDLQPMGEAALRFRARVRGVRSGTVHGLLLWFGMELAGEWLSSGPRSPPIAWKQVLFPLERPLAVEQGAELELSLEGGAFGDEMVWRWRVEAGGEKRGADNLETLSLDAGRLARWEPDAVPRRSRAGELELAVLELIDGRRSLEGIVGELEARFPGRFPSPELIQRRVLEIVDRMSEERAPEEGVPWKR